MPHEAGPPGTRARHRHRRAGWHPIAANALRLAAPVVLVALAAAGVRLLPSVHADRPPSSPAQRILQFSVAPAPPAAVLPGGRIDYSWSIDAVDQTPLRATLCFEDVAGNRRLLCREYYRRQSLNVRDHVLAPVEPAWPCGTVRARLEFRWGDDRNQPLGADQRLLAADGLAGIDVTLYGDRNQGPPAGRGCRNAHEPSCPEVPEDEPVGRSVALPTADPAIDPAGHLPVDVTFPVRLGGGSARLFTDALGRRVASDLPACREVAVYGVSSPVQPPGMASTGAYASPGRVISADAVEVDLQAGAVATAFFGDWFDAATAPPAETPSPGPSPTPTGPGVATPTTSATPVQVATATASEWATGTADATSTPLSGSATRTPELARPVFLPFARGGSES